MRQSLRLCVGSAWCSETAPSLRSPVQTRNEHIQLHYERILHSRIIPLTQLEASKARGCAEYQDSPWVLARPAPLEVLSSQGCPARRTQRWCYEYHDLYCSVTKSPGDRSWCILLCTLKNVSCPRELTTNGDKKKTNQVIQQMWEREEDGNSTAPPWQAVGTLRSPPAGRDEVSTCSTSSLQLPQQIHAEATSHINVETHLRRKRRDAHIYNPLGLCWVL